MQVYIVYEQYEDDYDSASAVVKVFANEYKAMDYLDELNANKSEGQSYYIDEEEVVV